MKIKLSVLTIASIIILTTTTQAAQVNFTPRLSAGVEYTDNFFLVEDEEENSVDKHAT